MRTRTREYAVRPRRAPLVSRIQVNRRLTRSNLRNETVDNVHWDPTAIDRLENLTIVRELDINKVKY